MGKLQTPPRVGTLINIIIMIIVIIFSIYINTLVVGALLIEAVTKASSKQLTECSVAGGVPGRSH